MTGVYVVANASEAKFDSVAQKLDQFTVYAKKAQKDWQVPGMSIAIVENGKIVYQKGFGARNVQGDPVTPDTIFDIASLTKSFTATLLALQIDQGKYTWDTPVQTLYSPFKLYNQKTTRKFAVRDLMAHDSGLPEDALDDLYNFGYSSKAIMHAVRFVKPVAPFRKEFAYQDVFSEFAKTIIEKASDKNYTATLHQNLLTPLHMEKTYTRVEPVLNTLANTAQPFQYYLTKNYPYPKDSPYLTKMWALKPGLAGGGIHSTAVDLAKWLIFNMHQDLVENQQIVSKKNIDFIHTPQTIISTAKGKIGQAYGEGWYIDKEAYKPYTVLYHAGGGTGTHSFIAYIPEKKLGIVILTNQWGNKVPEVLYQRLFDLSLKHSPLVDWNTIYLEKYRNISTKNNISLSEPCKKMPSREFLNGYTGIYYNQIYGNLKISVTKDNKLILSIGPQHIIWYLTYCQKNIFTAYWPNPNHMSIPMLDEGQNHVEFTAGKMKIPYLGNDNVFIKKAESVND